MENLIKPLAKTVLIQLGLTTATSSSDAGIHKKVIGSGTTTTTQITSSDEVEYIMEMDKSLEYFGL